MPKPSIRDWIYAQHLHSDLMEQFEKLFALPEKWHKDGVEEGDSHTEWAFDHCGEQLSAILEGK